MGILSRSDREVIEDTYQNLEQKAEKLKERGHPRKANRVLEKAWYYEHKSYGDITA